MYEFLYQAACYYYTSLRRTLVLQHAIEQDSKQTLETQ
jgi:hypothetical protein